MYSPVNIRDYLSALALIKKQSAYGTATADNLLINSVLNIGWDTPEITQQKWNDAERIGKPHDFSTAERELMRDLRMTRNYDLSSALGAFVAAMGMGSVATTALSPGYTHV